jgi:endonuclease/exonuclease/phosphatase family metal-dependent hydrolase
MYISIAMIPHIGREDRDRSGDPAGSFLPNSRPVALLITCFWYSKETMGTSLANVRAPALIIATILLFASPVSGRGMPWVDAGRQIVNVNTDRLTGDTFTVVTFNMLHGHGNKLNDATLEERLMLLAAGIAEAKPDVVILQEASVTPGRHGNVAERLRDSLNERLGGEGISYNSVFAMANGSRLIGFFEGSAILSRFQILSAESLVYEAQAFLPPERRIALRARIAASGEAGASSIEVVGTHLTNTEARRKGRLKRTMQAKELAAWLLSVHEDEPMLRVIGGDFNDTPGSDTVQAMLASGARDVWSEGPGFTAVSGSLTDPHAVADARIDYLFVHGRAAFVEWARSFLGMPLPRQGGGVLWSSDHIGVLASIGLR